MTTPALAIKARNLSKTYRIYSRPIDVLLEAMTRKKRYSEFKALDDINLDLHRGEIVGIMGRNGAGKSTLLKLIAGTLSHTSGELEVNGRITAILELGTGFNPEHTGRRNIYMGGLCLGMSKSEIDKKLESIIDFSELEDVIDQPFKTYSTGMQARLTFSTAISVDPDILIIDEALSVGDAQFQMKCFSKIRSLKKNNHTILLVTHDSNTVNTFCDRAIALEHGQIIYEGSPKYVSYNYLALLFGNNEVKPVSQASSDSVFAVQKSEGLERSYGNQKASIIDFGILDIDGRKVSLVEAGKQYSIFFAIHFTEDEKDLSFGFRVLNPRGIAVYGTSTSALGIDIPSQSKNTVYEAIFKVEMWLAPGDFFLAFGVAQANGGQIIERKLDALQFKVVRSTPCYSDSLANLNAIFVGEAKRV